MVKVQENKHYIFIVGCYNSGTSLLNNLLAQHNEISGLPSEGVALTGQIPRPEDIGWNRMWHRCRDQVEISSLNRKPDHQLVKKNWAFWFDPSKLFFLEKSIINSLNIDWLEEKFNHPYFLWIVRNGYAVAEGIQRRTSEPSRHPSIYIGGYPIEMCARQWVVNNQVIEEKLSNVRNSMKVTYEELTAAPKSTIKKIIDMIPLKNKSIIIPEEFEFHQQRLKIRNMNRDSIERLTDEQISSITNEAREMIINQGYEILKGNR